MPVTEKNSTVKMAFFNEKIFQKVLFVIVKIVKSKRQMCITRIWNFWMIYYPNVSVFFRGAHQNHYEQFGILKANVLIDQVINSLMSKYTNKISKIISKF